MTTPQHGEPSGGLETFRMPDVGEGLTEAEVLSWRVAVGDTVTVNQVLVEIETAKAAVELPSPFAGRVHALLVDEGVTVAVGTPIIAVTTAAAAGPVDQGPLDAVASPGGEPAVAERSGGASADAGAKIGEAAADGRIATLVGYVSAGGATARRPRRGAAPAPAPTTTAAPAAPAALAAPPVRKLAKDLGLDLAAVTASRGDGVIRRVDVLAAAGHEEPPAGHDHPATTQAVGRGAGEQRIPVKGVRKATAAAMVSSAFTAPHVTEFLSVDVTATMELRERLRRRPEYADVALTPLALVARAVCLAVRRTPEINASWESGSDGEGDTIVLHPAVHLGIAVATDRGLVVPTVQDADGLDLQGLALALGELTQTARAGRSTPAALSGGTFTITNVGSLGVDTGTPILNPGQVGILALGSIKPAPWVVDGALAVRQVCQLALSFDHRVVDGAQGARFLADVGALLGDPALALAF